MKRPGDVGVSRSFCKKLAFLLCLRRSFSPGEGSCLPSGRREGVLLTAPVSGLPAWWGRFPLGVPFERAKGTKTRLGRSPLRTSLGYEAVPASSLSSALVPVGSHGWPGKSMGSAPLLCETVPLLPGPYPGERRCRRRSLGTAVHQDKALGVEGLCFREVGMFCRSFMPSM